MDALSSIEKKSGSISVLVLGDIMVDEYHLCRAERKSPEGPFLVWELLGITRSFGGAGNLAVNAGALGAKVTLAGIAGDGELDRMASERGIVLVVERDGRPTTLKRRFMDAETRAPIAREDVESREPVQRAAAGFLARRLRGEFDAVVYSDYAKGMFNKESIGEFAKIRAKVKMADVKPENAHLFKGVAGILKMNFREFSRLAEMHGEKVRNEDADMGRAGAKVREALGADLLITRSEKGMSYIGKEAFHAGGRAKEVTDITGAGDTSAAAFAVALACGLGVRDALEVANAAGSVKVGKRGAVPVSLEEIGKEMGAGVKKVVGEGELRVVVGRMRAAGKKIVFTNGCFDLMHHGHVVFLQKARELGDVLIVALNSDASVRKLKGAGRPRIPEHGRVGMLAAFPFVDYVVVFGTDTPEHLVEELKPDVYVKGKDYSGENLPEARIVERYGGKVVLLDLVTENGEKVSSSKLAKGQK